MYYKEYGNTGCRVSAIGFGGMRFSEEDVKRGDLEACAEVVRYAHEKGINYFDTAPGYCDDKSETIMGLALNSLPRDSYYINTKTNFYQVDNPATEAGFFRRLETSLKRLRVDCIDFYHLWCMLSLVQYRKQCDALYGYFRKAKEQGMIRHIVFSSHMPGDELTQVIGEGLFEGMLIGYNALNYRYRMSGLTAAHRQGMGVVVMNPLGGGVIPANPQLFSSLTEGTPYTTAQGALRFVAGHREVSVALNGITAKEQVDEAVFAVQGLEERPADAQAALLPASGGENALCTGCGYCDSCPVQIPIPKFMDAYNQKLLTGRDPAARLQNHWALKPDIAADCIACGQCEGLCTQHLPIIGRLREIQACASDA
ncbi:MAG TPA: aldo/keto reductase [Feifaniaceae bacterium]|nr:aldo/keto reductase [Feifaniaceae bacterium]